MTYTAEQLRNYASSAGNVWYAPILLAFADALEENARLKAEKPAPQWLTDNLLQRAERARLKEEQTRAAKIFADALMQWGVEKTELQAELAKLRQHAEEMAWVLKWLDSQGGKGLQEHRKMKKALEDYRADFPEEK